MASPSFGWGAQGAGSFGVLGTLVAGAAAIALSVRTGTWLPGMILTLGGISGGVFLGRRRSRDICSDSDCHVVLPAASDKCPGCGRAIMGRIRDRDEIVDALERLQAQGLWSPESVFECEDETQ